jgi:hypothetical protein
MTCAELDNITNLEAYLIKEKNDWFPEVTGKTIANSLVKIIWPDGSTNETQSDKKGNYKISANTKQFGWEIRIKIPTEEEYDKKTKISNTSFSYKRENIYKENLLIYKIKKQKNEILSLNNPIIHIKWLENPFLKNLGWQQDKKENLNLPKQIIFKNLKIPHILFDYKNPKKQDIIDMLKMGRNMSEKEKIYSPAFIYALQVSLSILWKWESLWNIDWVWWNKTKKSLEILVKENGISPNEILSSQSIQNIINKLWII